MSKRVLADFSLSRIFYDVSRRDGLVDGVCLDAFYDVLVNGSFDEAFSGPDFYVSRNASRVRLLFKSEGYGHDVDVVSSELPFGASLSNGSRDLIVPSVTGVLLRGLTRFSESSNHGTVMVAPVVVRLGDYVAVNVRGKIPGSVEVTDGLCFFPSDPSTLCDRIVDTVTTLYKSRSMSVQNGDGNGSIVDSAV